MFYFEVSANDMILGTWEAESEQQAPACCTERGRAIGNASLLS